MQILLLHQQILITTERLRDLHRSTMLHSSPIPASEMEILLQEIRNLYGLVLQLNNENALNLLNEVKLAVTQQMPVISKPTLAPAEESSTIHPSKPEEILLKVTEAKILEIKHTETSVTEEKSTQKKYIVSDIHEMFQDVPSVADRFSDHQTIAERIAGTGSMKRVSDNQKTSVKDIKAAIGLNEKFQFINQLFNGDAKKYHSVIDELNVSPSVDFAMNYVREISESNNWESHPASAKSFIDIIERRFSV